MQGSIKLKLKTLVWTAFLITVFLCCFYNKIPFLPVEYESPDESISFAASRELLRQNSFTIPIETKSDTTVSMPMPISQDSASEFAVAETGKIYASAFIQRSSIKHEPQAKRIDERQQKLHLEAAQKAAPMIRLGGGTFRMGNSSGSQPDQRPAHDVSVSPFEIDIYPVTNRQFQHFVLATDYITSAEKRGWSYVFDFELKKWIRKESAHWRRPTGKEHPEIGRENSSVTFSEAFLQNPVVHVSHDDARNFCDWMGKRLPTEAEWEFAAKGGKIDIIYPWGNEREPKGKKMANYWQGWMPDENTLADGFLCTSPVGMFPENGYGLYDMAGNVWEWTQDRYEKKYYMRSPTQNPLGAAEREAEKAKVEDPVSGEIVSVNMRSIRGGSFMSGENSDAAYKIGVRARQPQSISYQDIGFRCVNPKPN